MIQFSGRFSLLDEQTGWAWQNIKEYKSVLAMMRQILDQNLQLHDAEYKRLRRLEGHEWEAELKQRAGHSALGREIE